MLYLLIFFTDYINLFKKNLLKPSGTSSMSQHDETLHVTRSAFYAFRSILRINSYHFPIKNQQIGLCNLHGVCSL